MKDRSYGPHSSSPLQFTSIWNSAAQWSPKPILGHPRYGSWKSPFDLSLIRSHSDYERVLLLLRRLWAHRLEVLTADLVGPAVRVLAIRRRCCSLCPGALYSLNTNPCHSLFSWWLLCWYISYYEIDDEASENSEWHEKPPSQVPPPSRLVLIVWVASMYLLNTFSCYWLHHIIYGYQSCIVGTIFI